MRIDGDQGTSDGAMARSPVILAAFALFAAFVGGCATPNKVHYATINAPPHPFVRRDPATVDVFVSKLPARPYVEVGMFQVYQGVDNDGGLLSTEDMIRTLRAHAGLRGCDGVQVLGIDHAPRYKHSTREIVQGVCVLYTDEQAQRAGGPPTAAKPLPASPDQ
jgi:hypothetical protein